MQLNIRTIAVATLTGVVILYAGYNMMWPSGGSTDASAKSVSQVGTGANDAKGKATGGDGKLPASTKGGAAAAAVATKTTYNVLASKFELKKTLTGDLLDKAKNSAVKIQEKEIKLQIGNQKPMSIFYREADGGPDKVPILLLHGMKFSSANWAEIQTIQIASRLGHRVIAVDLPGYGKSSGVKAVSDKGAFLDLFIGAVRLGSPIIVSPSMSGFYSLPFVLGKYTHKASGFLPIAPVTTDKHTQAEYKTAKVPVLIMYGGKDLQLGVEGAKHLKQFSNSHVHVINEGGHAVYMEKPDEWHTVLTSFLQLYTKA